MILGAELSPGLKKALTKNGLRDFCSCRFPRPKYPGRYPSKCPVCQQPWGAPNQPAEPADGIPSGDVPEHRRERRSRVTESGRKVDRVLRRKITADFIKAGLDGNGRFESVGKVLSATFDVLAKHGIESDDTLNAHRFGADSGSRSIALAWTNAEDSFSPESISDTEVYVSWTKLGEDRYEAVVYLT